MVPEILRSCATTARSLHCGDEMAATTKPLAMSRSLLLVAAVLALVACVPAAPDAPASKAKPVKSKAKLTRSDGKRWERLSETIKTEVKTATRKFLEDRDQVAAVASGGAHAWVHGCRACMACMGGAHA